MRDARGDAGLLIYTPSIARFRLVYFEERLAAAHLATLAIQASDAPGQISEAVSDELLSHVGAYSVVRIENNNPKMLLARAKAPAADASFNIQRHRAVPLIIDAFSALAQGGNRILKVVGPSPKNPALLFSITIDEKPLRLAMHDYSWRILKLSVLISLITAALVFLSLRWMMVRPMQRITEGLVQFRRSTEDSTHDTSDDGRLDEIGVAQRELASMKQGLRAALRQKARLVLLGTAVNKINHDLRNMLSTANLISDRLAESTDATVRRVGPPLIRAIDRAVELCSQSLNFTQDTPPLRLGSVSVEELVRDLQALFAETLEAPFEIALEDPQQTELRADRTQIYRVLSNPAGNAASVGAKHLVYSVRLDHAERIRVAIADDGPGISSTARETLFQPFQHHSERGGYGLAWRSRMTSPRPMAAICILRAPAPRARCLCSTCRAEPMAQSHRK